MEFSDKYWVISLTPTKAGWSDRKARGMEYRAARAHLEAKGLKAEYRFAMRYEGRADLALARMQEALSDFPLTYAQVRKKTGFSLYL